jgi:hypothetical protein
VGSNLDEVELSQAELDGVAFHRSTIEGITGAAALRNCTIGPEQVVSFALPVLGALGIRVTEEDPEDESA